MAPSHLDGLRGMNGRAWHTASHGRREGDGDDDLRVVVIVRQQVQIISTVVFNPDDIVARVFTMTRLLCTQRNEESIARIRSRRGTRRYNLLDARAVQAAASFLLRLTAQQSSQWNNERLGKRPSRCSHNQAKVR